MCGRTRRAALAELPRSAPTSTIIAELADGRLQQRVHTHPCAARHLSLRLVELVRSSVGRCVTERSVAPCTRARAFRLPPAQCTAHSSSGPGPFAAGLAAAFASGAGFGSAGSGPLGAGGSGFDSSRGAGSTPESATVGMLSTGESWPGARPPAVRGPNPFTPGGPCQRNACTAYRAARQRRRRMRRTPEARQATVSSFPHRTVSPAPPPA
jgi:hypothetical protein